MFYLQNFLTVWITVFKIKTRSLIHINAFQLEEREEQQFCIPEDIDQHFEILGLSQLGSTTGIQDGKNTAKHPNLQGVVSTTQNNPSQMPAVLRLRSLDREE